MKLNIESINKKNFPGLGRIANSLTALILVFVFIYIDIWFFAPTGPLARLPNCIRDVFSNHSNGLDISDGRISGLFATEPRSGGHFGMIYTVLQFSENGSVSEYHVAEQSMRGVNARRVLLWIELYKYPSLAPVFELKTTGWDPLGDRHFFVFSPETAIYIIDREKINFVLYEIDDGMDFTEHWEGTISGENLVFTEVLADGFEREEVYFYINYDTCPIGKE